MTLRLRLAAIAFGSLSFLPLHAAEVDPLWAKVVAQTEEGKKWVAKDMDLTMEAHADGKDEKRKVQMQLNGWDDKKPVYKTVSVEPPEDPGKTGKKGRNDLTKFSLMSEDMIKMDKKVARTDRQVFDNKPATLFVVDESKGPAAMKMQVWVDPVNGSIYKIQSTAHVTLMMDMELNIAYQPISGSLSLPSQSEMKLEVLVPFNGAKVHMKSNSANWIQRPL